MSILDLPAQWKNGTSSFGGAGSMTYHKTQGLDKCNIMKSYYLQDNLQMP